MNEWLDKQGVKKLWDTSLNTFNKTTSGIIHFQEAGYTGSIQYLKIADMKPSNDMSNAQIVMVKGVGGGWDSNGQVNFDGKFVTRDTVRFEVDKRIVGSPFGKFNLVMINNSIYIVRNSYYNYSIEVIVSGATVYTDPTPSGTNPGTIQVSLSDSNTPFTYTAYTGQYST